MNVYRRYRQVGFVSSRRRRAWVYVGLWLAPECEGCLRNILDAHPSW